MTPTFENLWQSRTAGAQGSLLPNDVWDSSMYGKLGLNITDVPTRLKDMDTEQIDISVLFPTGGSA